MYFHNELLTLSFNSLSGHVLIRMPCSLRVVFNVDAMVSLQKHSINIGTTLSRRFMLGQSLDI